MDAMQQTREDLAAALRLAVKFNFHEGICNHFSAMVPGFDEGFLINPQGLHWAEITASSLLLVSYDGEVLAGDHPVEATAFYIHGALHQRLPQARCVLHTHMPNATALTTLEDPTLEPISQTALGFYGRIAYDPDYNGLALDTSEGERIAAAMADKPVAFLANHGVVVTGPDMGAAFNDLYYLERACELQIKALSTGRSLKRVSGQVAERTARQYVAPDNAAQVSAHFTALKRLLAQDLPDYRC